MSVRARAVPTGRPAGLTPRLRSLIIEVLRRSPSRPGRRTLTTEEWQEIRNKKNGCTSGRTLG